MGKAPTVAAEIQLLAAANEVLISEATHGLVRHHYRCEEAAPERAVADSPKLYRVIGAPAEEPAPERPLLERDEELALLEKKWKLSRRGRGRMVLVSGEPGIGKSLLVERLCRRVEDPESRRVISRCQPDQSNTALWPVAHLLRKVLGIRRETAPGESRRRLEELLGRCEMKSEENFDLLSAFLGLAGRRGGSGKRMIGVLVELILRLAEKEPWLWVIEDLDWVDPSTGSLLNQLAGQLPSTRMLLVLTVEPGYQPPWGMPGHHSWLRLDPLTPEGAEELVRRVRGNRPVSSEWLRKVVEHADGVPFYVEALSGSEGGGVPEVVQERLTAYFPRLGPRAVRTAQVAAVIYRNIPFHLLYELLPFDEGALFEALGRMVHLGLLDRRGSGKRAVYEFRHPLYQKAAYGSMLEKDRKSVHEQIARILEDHRDVAEAHPEWLAHHYERAGLGTEGARWRLRSGGAAMIRGANTEATRHLRKGLELLGEESSPDARLEFELQVDLGRALLPIRGVGAAEVKEAFDRALHLSSDLDGRPDFDALRGLCWYYTTVARWKEARDLAEELKRVAGNGANGRERTLAMRAVGALCFYRGELEAAHDHLREGLASCPEDRLLSREPIHPRVDCQTFLAWVTWHLGRADEALRIADEALDFARERPEMPYSLATALAAKALVHRLRGEDDEVVRLCDELRRHAEKHEFRLAVASAQLLGGPARARRDPAEGVELLEEGLRNWEASGARSGLTLHLADFAGILLEDGRLSEAKTRLEEARGFALYGERFYLSEILRLEGELALRQGQRDQAVRSFTEALTEARRRKNLALEQRALRSLEKNGASRLSVGQSENVIDLSDGAPLGVRSSSPRIGDAARFHSPEVPPRLQNFLAKQLDDLESTDKDLAQWAAVLEQPGPGFSEQVLLAVARYGAAELSEALSRLCEAEVLFEEGCPELRYTFHHDSMRKTAYSLMLEKERWRRHEKAARVLAGIPELVERHAERIAYHFEAAGLGNEAENFRSTAEYPGGGPGRGRWPR